MADRPDTLLLRAQSKHVNLRSKFSGVPVESAIRITECRTADRLLNRKAWTLQAATQRSLQIIHTLLETNT